MSTDNDADFDDDLTISESTILGLIEDAEKAYTDFDPAKLGEHAVKAQLALVAVTGYQALAIDRLVNGVSSVNHTLVKLAKGFETGTPSAKALVTAVEDLRKVISSNGFDSGPR